MSTGHPRACVIGDPIAHSRSPLIHGHWLRCYGIPGSYERVRVRPDELAAFIGNLSANGYVGCNVTIPHKEETCRLVPVRDETANVVGAVNTVWIRDGVAHGANTDVSGFLANLDAEASGWDRASFRAVVLGAGGAARGIVHGLRGRGAASIAIVNRTAARARALARDMGLPASAHGWDELPALLAEADLLVNATSLGMAGKPPPVLPLEVLRRGALVTDIVYVPLETAFLAAARRRGHAVVDGLGMLLHQAVPGFERWFGVRPEVTPELRRVLIDDISGA